MGFWIRGDRLADEALLLGDILAWLDAEWQFPKVSFGTFDTNARQATLYSDLGMRVRFRFPHPRGADVVYYHQETD